MKSRIRSAAMLSAAVIAMGASYAEPALARVDPATKKVAILIFDNVQVIDYSGPLEVLSDAGFDVFTVAETREPVTTSAGDAVKLTPKYTFADAPQADLVVIPGGGFEAAKDSATVAWIKRQTEHAEHTMSVCNGAFTLANTGLLDGLRATTTAGNISRMRSAYPSITVVGDQRVVDNGKILTTAGLSAGIDGALHMVDVMKGDGAGQTVALEIEYDWSPDRGYVRGEMADRFIPRALRNADIGEQFDITLKGDKDRWETVAWYKTKLAPAELFARVKTAYEKAYALDGTWAPGSFKAEPSGPLALAFRFDDRDGHHWTGVIAAEPVEGEAGQLALRIAIDRTA